MTNGLDTERKTNPIDEDLKKILEEELPSLSEEIKEKKKRKYQKKKDIEILQIGTTLLIPINYIFNRLSDVYQEPAFKLNEFETQEFENAIDKVAGKYLPLWLDKYSSEIGLLIISFAIFYPRYKLYLEIKKKKTQTQTQTLKENDKE